MTGYTKLFSTIVTSTIWGEDDKIRILWITMLALCEKDGIVYGTIPGIATMARISVPDCEAALNKLTSPDKYSRSKEFDGRRIKPIEGGWLILNRNKYRELGQKESRQEYQRDYMRYYRNPVNKCKHSVNNRKPQLAQTETETETEKKQRYMDFVFLSDIEHQKLIEKFGEVGTTERIATLNDGIGSKGYKYKSHYHTILSWERMHKEKVASAPAAVITSKKVVFCDCGCGRELTKPSQWSGNSGKFFSVDCRKKSLGW